jgi:hypothetical protein
MALCTAKIHAALVTCAWREVSITRYQSRRITDWLQGVVEDWMGLEINRDKAHIVEPGARGASLDFPEYCFRYE